MRFLKLMAWMAVAELILAFSPVKADELAVSTAASQWISRTPEARDAQLAAVLETRSTLGSILGSEHKAEAAACVQVQPPELALFRALAYYHDRGEPDWLQRMKLQTLVAVSLRMLCDGVDA